MTFKDMPSFNFRRHATQPKRKLSKVETSQAELKKSLSRLSLMKILIVISLLAFYTAIQVFLFCYMWPKFKNERLDKFNLSVGEPLRIALLDNAEDHAKQTELLAVMNTPDLDISQKHYNQFLAVTDVMAKQVPGAKTKGVRLRVEGTDARQAYENLTSIIWQDISAEYNSKGIAPKQDPVQVELGYFNKTEFPITGYGSDRVPFVAPQASVYYPKLYKNPQPTPDDYTVNSDGLLLSNDNVKQLNLCVDNDTTNWGPRRTLGSTKTFGYMLLSNGPSAVGLTIFEMSKLLKKTFMNVPGMTNGVRAYLYDHDEGIDEVMPHTDSVYLGSYIYADAGDILKDCGLRTGPETLTGGTSLQNYAAAEGLDDRSNATIANLNIEIPYELVMNGDSSAVDPLVYRYFVSEKYVPNNPDDVIKMEYTINLNNRQWGLLVTADGTYNPVDIWPYVGVSIAITGLFICLFALLIAFDMYIRKSRERIYDAERVAHEMLLGYLCHELRNPLHTIRMLARDIRCKDAESAESLGYLTHSSDHMNDILNAFLDMTKFNNAGSIDPVYMPNDIMAICRDIVHQYRAMDRLAEKNLEYEIDCRSDYLYKNWFLIDKMRLNQVLRNGLSNASKYTESGKISLILDSVICEKSAVTASSKKMSPGDHPEDDKYCIEFIIRDTGSGLGSSDPESFFDEFSSSSNGNTASNTVASTGLGLPMTRKIAEALGGCVFLRNREDGVQGAEFVFRIPCIEAEHLLPQRIEPCAESNPIRDFSKIKLYACEDEPTSAALLRRLLGKIGITNIELFADGLELISHMRNSQEAYPDIVLLDRHMKFSQGDDICTQLRDEFDVTCPIIAMTGSHFTEPHTFDDVLLKPFSLQDLSTMIENHIVRHRNASRTIVCCEDEPVHALILRRALEASYYRNVTIYDDGVELMEHMDAVARGERPSPDMLIVDIVMKRSRGDEICAKLRQNNVDIPILALTGNTSPNDVARYRECGFDDIIGKPFERGDFLNRVDQLFIKHSEGYHSSDYVRSLSDMSSEVSNDEMSNVV